MNIDLFGNLIVEEPEIEAPKAQKISPFEYTTAIADKKYPDNFDGYNAWLTNSSFSQRQDTVFYANEINKYHRLGDREQFDFYYYSLPKKKYFAKWAKADKSKNTDAICFYYSVSAKVAEQYEKVLNDVQIKHINSWFNNKEGGK